VIRGLRHFDPPISTSHFVVRAVVAAAAAVVGVAIGRLWDSQAESVPWRRDRTVTSYLRLAEAFRTS
jgi:hypothetical protein